MENSKEFSIIIMIASYIFVIGSNPYLVLTVKNDFLPCGTLFKPTQERAA